MQWSSDEYGGYSSTKKRVVPIIDHAQHGYARVNVADQRRDPESLLNWTERRIRARKELPEIGWGECTVLSVESPSVLVLRYEWRNVAFVAVHNFADARRVVHFDVGTDNGGLLCDVFDDNHSRADAAGQHAIRLGPYGYRWFRVGRPDTTPVRSTRI
jgi:maltose alpha-D-glucosyltransferase/alpha-amylase